MRFPMPHLPLEFEIPDAWLHEAGFQGQWPMGEAYRSKADAERILLTSVEPVARFKESPKDGNGFDRLRLINALRGILSGDEIPPVRLMELPYLDLSPSPYRYTVKDGYHRFFASIAAGFSILPADIVND